MANNLHISYDLINPGQNYDQVIERIKQLGSCAKPHMSVWYVNSRYSAVQAVEHLKPALDGNDKIYLVDATNNHAAWNRLPQNIADEIIDQWFR